MTSDKQNIKTIKIKNGETISIPESSVKYLDALKTIVASCADIEEKLSDMLESFQTVELPTKSDELEMENSSIVIFTSTALSNIRKIKESAKNSAKCTLKKTKLN